ncbi:MAG: protease inhibitor I42 family protein [Dehalococcoidia bacterium]|jgi:predicted secreted protein
MNITKAAAAIILGIILAVSISCGGKGALPTPQPKPTLTPTITADPNHVNIDASYNGNQVALAEGKQLILTLNANGPTGYTWNLSAISDANIIRKVRNTYEAPVDSLPVSTWYFEALAAGTATISMREFKASEPEPVNTFEITVIVE